MNSSDPEREAVRQRLKSQRGRELAEALERAKNNPDLSSNDMETRLRASFRHMDAGADFVTYAAGLPKDKTGIVLRVLYGSEGLISKPPTLGTRLRRSLRSLVHKYSRQTYTKTFSLF